MVEGRIIAEIARCFRVQRDQTSSRGKDRCRRYPIPALLKLERGKPDRALILLDVTWELRPGDVAISGRRRIGRLKRGRLRVGLCIRRLRGRRLWRRRVGRCRNSAGVRSLCPYPYRAHEKQEDRYGHSILMRPSLTRFRSFQNDKSRSDAINQRRFGELP